MCAATFAEAAACRRGIAAAGASGLEVLLTGVGPDRAAARLYARLARGPRPALVVSSGFAGALTPGLEMGALVTARALHRLEAATPWRSRSRRGSCGSRPAPARSSSCSATHVPAAEPRGLPAPAAVDMESAALALACAGAGVPFTVLRVVTDTPAAPLPPLARSIAAALAARGLARSAAVARAVALAVRRPVRTATFVRASLGWCRRLRGAWREAGASVAAGSAKRAGERQRSAN